jgi:hypothetical protein
MTDMTFTHKIFSGPAEHIPAMNRVKKIIADANLVSKKFFFLLSVTTCGLYYKHCYDRKIHH